MVTGSAKVNLALNTGGRVDGEINTWLIFNRTMNNFRKQI